MRASIVASLASFVALAHSASAVAVWGQCGGTGWNGGTSCDSGSSCVVQNPYYSQCIPSNNGGGGGGGGSCSTETITATATVTSTETDTYTETDTVTVSDGGATVTVTVTGSGTPTSTPTDTPTSTPTGLSCPNKAPFKLFGVSESGAEFGTGTYPGTLNKDYTFPATSSIDYFVGLGMNSFRIPLALERLVPLQYGLTNVTQDSFNMTYVGILIGVVNYITETKGAYAIVDPHNYMRYNGTIITDASQFSGFWYIFSQFFAGNDNVIFDLMNEPYGIDAGTVFGLEQSAIYAIRAAGQTSQMIMAEGTSWTGAWTWQSSGNADAFAAITDPNNNVAIEMHQYLDSDGSGTNGTCISPAIGAQRIQDATTWLQQNNLKGYLGEIGAGSNDVCAEAVYVTFCAMASAEGSPWLGASWWAAGPWWGSYFTSIEPPNGPAISEILPVAIQPFLPATGL